MLTEKVNYTDALDLIATQDAATVGQTVFQSPLQLFNTKPLFISKTPKLGGGDVWDSADPTEVLGAPQEIVDTYSVQPVEDGGQKFRPEMDIPGVLGISTTDKTSYGVFEKPLIPVDRTDLTGIPVDATPLLNDATDGLTTIRSPNNSPLGLGYSGGSAYIQPTDPMPLAYGAPEDLATPEETTTCSWYDFPCKFKSVKGEATVLIVGVILLAIGVFALTK